MEVGTAYEGVGDCEHALEVFERYRAQRPSWERSEIDWHIGTCSFQLARQRREEGQLEEALQLVGRTLEVGEPRNILGQAWFEKGEILAALGDCDASVEALYQVRYY